MPTIQMKIPGRYVRPKTKHEQRRFGDLTSEEVIMELQALRRLMKRELPEDAPKRQRTRLRVRKYFARTRIKRLVYELRKRNIT